MAHQQLDPDERRRRHDVLVSTTTDYAIFTLSLDNVVESWNRGAERIFEYSADEAIGRNGSFIFVPEDRLSGAPERELATALASGRADDVRWHLRKSGTRFWATGVMLGLPDDSGRIARVAKIIADSTRKKMAEDALLESEARLQLVAASIPQLIWTARADGAVDYLNSRWAEYVGQAAELALGWRWQDAVHPEDAARVLERWLHSVRTGLPFESELRLRRSDGSYRWFLAKATPVQGSTGPGARWFGTCTDIQELKESETALREAQKLESIGVLAGGVAHDFNNLLTGILGNTTLALRLLPETGSERARPLLQEVVDASERAAELTRQLLAYAGKGRFAVEPVDLCRLVEESRDLMVAAAPKHVGIQLDVPRDCPRVMGDRGQLQQLVMNLVLNGAEAIDAEAGTVRVTARAVTFGERELRDPGFLRQHAGAELVPGHYVELSVHDTGHGMSAEVRERIFEPFFTTRFLGRGLGLPAALGIVRAHGGAIRVGSVPGEGSVVTAVIPAADAAAETGAHGTATESSASDAAQGSGVLSILVVDDEEPVRAVARRMLEDLGYRVRVAENGREALRAYGAAPGEIDVVLLDLTMPVMDGEATMQELRRIAPDLRVVLMSGYGDIEALRRVPTTGSSGFLAKPFTFETLSAVLGAATE